MKYRIAVFALVFGAWQYSAAQVGNEWINFSQDYYKIAVAKDGIYRLTQTDLANAGFPVNLDPRNIQLFHRGTQQAIFIAGETDGQWDVGDYLEFYGVKNDGTLDSLLYHPDASAQPHKLYNLFSDSTAYFLTVSGSAGKRMAYYEEANDGSPTEVAHTNRMLKLFTNGYCLGETFNGVIQRAGFDKLEGWTSGVIRENQNFDNTFTGLNNKVTAAGTPGVELLIIGRDGTPHQYEVYAGPSSGSLRLLTTQSFFGYNKHRIQLALQWSDIGVDGSLVVRLRPIGVSGQIDQLSLSYIKVNYTEATAMDGAEKIFELLPNPDGKSYVEITGAPAGPAIFDVTDRANVRRIGFSGTGTLQAMVNNAVTSRTLLVTSTRITPSLKEIHFRQIAPSQHDYIIVSNKLLMKPGGAYSDPVHAYGGYRASAQGGSYDTLVVDVDQLYNQFSYGEPTPLAIHNLMRYMIAGGNPRYLFLIGKGLDAWWNYHRTPASFTTNFDLVPTPGMPGSDMFFTAGMDGAPGVPAVATGRITANTPAQVAAYLDKVVEMESVPFDQLWRKDLLHLSGGIDPGEPELFKTYVQDFEAIAVDYYLGGKVASIAKRTTNPVELINISDQVNSGLSLITFFGHSSSSTIDFDIGYASDPVMGYANKGKYPMFLINGCQAGAFFSNGTVFGEDWIRTPDKGAIGFIAHASFGLINTLKLYSDMFYEVAFADPTFINKGVGDVQKEVARRYLDFAGNSVISESQVQQMVLLGDPSVSIFGAMQPDYEVTDNHLYLTSFDGGTINALADSFALNIVVRNFGKADKDTLSIRVTRTLNDNSTVTYDSLFAPVLYSDTLTFVIRKGHENGFGNNSFEVKLDADEYIDELSEDNNTATLGLFIPLNSTHNLFPHDFALAHAQSVDLSYQGTNQLAGERTFLVEMDTVNSFDSPYLKTFQRTANVYDKFTVPLLSQDSLTYYWRTRLADPLPGESDEWSLSSFTYIDQSPEGWGQLHFQQLLKNISEGIVVDADTRRLSFESSVTPVKIVNYGKDHPAVNTDVNVLIDGVEYNLTTQGFICRSNTMNFIAFDRRSTVPYVGLAFKWFNRAGRECGRAPWVINSFTPSQMVTGLGDDLIQYVDNVVTGDSVVMFSIDNAAFSTWPAAAKTKLGELGVSVAQIDALVDGEPVVIFGRKGSPAGTAKIYRASDSPAGQQPLTTEGTITGRYLSGEMTTPLIGPAASWSQLIYRTTEVEAQDLVTISVTGVELNGNETVLVNNASATTDLSPIDAAIYPYIKLTYTAEDDVNLTPAQLNKWLVFYESMAEGLLVYMGTATPVTVPEGVLFQARYGFVNISDKTFSDSLTVRSEAFNKDKLQLAQEYFKIYPPAPGDTAMFVTDLNTLGRSGSNDLDVFVNPRLIPELYYDNNVIELRDYLQVAADIYKPVVEVRFDGRPIIDGDFVSPNPTIEMRLWDENQFLRKADTVGVHIYLQYPCDTEDCPYERIALSRTDVSWQPATATSDFRVLFTPEGLHMGTYRLRVEAQDASGNAADPYLISFQITNENSVELLAPYPNPFDESVVFRFVVTGSENAGSFDLRVVDLGGKEVYTIQLANFPVGTSEVIWDGVDSTGRRLPPGLYLFNARLQAGNESRRRAGKLVMVR